MTIRDRTRPPVQRPRKSGLMTTSTVGTNPPSLDEPVYPGLPGTRRPGMPGYRPPPGNGGVMPPGTGTPVPPIGPRPPYVEPTPAPTGPPTVGINPPTTPTPVVPPGPTMGIQPIVPGTKVPPGPTMGTQPVTPGAPGVPVSPGGPNMGIPGGPGSGQAPVPQPGQLPPGWTPGQPLPPGFGLDFMREVTPNELVANQLQALLNSDSPYMRNAEQRGMEYAASRGNLNSSIGAGSARRAALEAAMPIAQADAQVYRDANAGNFESLSQLRQMRVAGDIENWLSSESYNREFNGQLAMIPITSSIDMLQYIMQRGMEDPAVYPPDVLSGMANFFNGNMFDILNRFYGTQTPGGD